MFFNRALKKRVKDLEGRVEFLSDELHRVKEGPQFRAWNSMAEVPLTRVVQMILVKLDLKVQYTTQQSAFKLEKF